MRGKAHSVWRAFSKNLVLLLCEGGAKRCESGCDGTVEQPAV